MSAGTVVANRNQCTSVVSAGSSTSCIFQVQLPAYSDSSRALTKSMSRESSSSTFNITYS
eukprot:1194331-Prorocentrum_minimum.AAC.5